MEREFEVKVGDKFMWKDGNFIATVTNVKNGEVYYYWTDLRTNHSFSADTLLEMVKSEVFGGSWIPLKGIMEELF